MLRGSHQNKRRKRPFSAYGLETMKKGTIFENCPFSSMKFKSLSVLSYPLLEDWQVHAY